MLHYRLFTAQGIAQFNLVIVHGMQEYSGRYANFAEFLAQQGGNIITFDLPGHGAEKRLDQLGDFGTDGLQRAFTDIENLFNSFSKPLPTILFGHSMGSAIALRYAETHPHLAQLILCGVPTNPVLVLNAGHSAAKLEEKLRPAQPSVFKLIFTQYNRAFRPTKTASDWLSVNEQNVQAYIADPLCGYPIKASYFEQMFGMMRWAFKKDELNKLDKNLKLLLINGEQDAVSQMGKGMTKLARYLTQQGYTLEHHTYPNLRHEILNEREHEQVYQTIAQFIHAHLNT